MRKCLLLLKFQPTDGCPRQTNLFRFYEWRDKYDENGTEYGPKTVSISYCCVDLYIADYHFLTDKNIHSVMKYRNQIKPQCLTTVYHQNESSSF